LLCLCPCPLGHVPCLSIGGGCLLSSDSADPLGRRRSCHTTLSITSAGITLARPTASRAWFMLLLYAEISFSTSPGPSSSLVSYVLGRCNSIMAHCSAYALVPLGHVPCLSIGGGCLLSSDSADPLSRRRSCHTTLSITSAGITLARPAAPCAWFMLLFDSYLCLPDLDIGFSTCHCFPAGPISSSAARVGSAPN
jgi:hypothetical protein